MQTLLNEITEHLQSCILPFWKSLRDDESGGFISYVDTALRKDPEGERGCILNSRILWFFSQAAITLHAPSLLDDARHAYEMLCQMTDIKNGGVYWSMHRNGHVFDSTKHTYNQAFAIYALSTYYLASGNRGALEKALQLFELIEEKCTDAYGYLESFSADWQPISNDKLSENGILAEKTMNTLLHVLEAYTELFRASGDARVRIRLYRILELFETKLYNPSLHRLEVFFDKYYTSMIDLTSFGHNIEACWLLDRTLEILCDDALSFRIRPRLTGMAYKTHQLAFTECGLFNEMEGDAIDTTRVWWVQAEALVGFLNAFEKTGDILFKQAALSQWNYIKAAIIDPRPSSEWFWQAFDNHTPDLSKPIVEPWKCPYHNGRMAFEVIERMHHAQLSGTPGTI